MSIQVKDTIRCIHVYNDADVIVNGLGVVNKSIIDASTKLRLVHQVGIGIDMYVLREN